jgi:competence protein ComEC
MEPTGPIDATPRRARRAPMVPVAAALVAGLLAGRYAPLPAALWAVSAALALTASAGGLATRRLRPALAGSLLLAVGAVGALHAHVAWRLLPDDHVVTYTGRAQVLATLRGQVITCPLTYEIVGDEHLGWSRGPGTSMTVRLEGIRLREGWRPVRGLARVRIDGQADHLRAGQRVELIGTMGRYRPADNPGQFDPAQAARRRHTLVWVRVPVPEGATVLREPSWWSRPIWQLRAAARQHLDGTGSPAEARIVSALVIGDRHPALRQLNRVMIRAGAAHLLSISGLHLGIFLGVTFVLARLIAPSSRIAAGVVLLVLTAYVLIAAPRAPLLRSATMAGLLCLAVLLSRRYVALNALATSGVLLLAIDPLQLFSAGFQLSFLIVGGLILLHRPVRQALFGRWLRRRGLMVFREDQAWRRWLHHRGAQWGIDLLVASLVAYAVSAPLVAYHFGLFNPYAMVLSVLLLPVVVAVLVPGYLSMALAWPMPNLSYRLGEVSTALAAWLARIAEACDHLPGVGMELRPLHVAWVLGAYATGAILLARRHLPFGPALSVGALATLAAATAYSQLPAPQPASAELDLLSVGNGQCAVLRAPSGQTYLIDAGTSRAQDAGRTVLLPFLRARRLPDPSAAFCSHANTDHYNAMPALIETGRLDTLYVGPYFGQDDRPSWSRRRFGELLAKAGVRVRRLSQGERLALDGRTSVEVLWPPPGETRLAPDASRNDRSLVLKVTCDGRSVLLPGDIDVDTQQTLLADANRLACDAVVLPHHGSWRPTLPKLLDATGAEVVLVSSARPPSGDSQEASAFYDRLRRRMRYFSTARNGHIHVEFGSTGVRVRSRR